MTYREARKTAKDRFGTDPLWGFCYSEGSRSVGDIIATIIKADCDDDPAEAEFWRDELGVLVPLFRGVV
jgi:hypothetical protein